MNGHRISLFLILCLFGIIAAQSAFLGDNKTKRNTGERVYLEHADELSYDSYGSHPDAQFLRGNVRFRHKGAVMTCDSAYFYQKENTFDAYGHVVITQGDSVELTSDFANYVGDTQIAVARTNVVLTHNKSTLYTDELTYDRLYNEAFYETGGKLLDKENTLTSVAGVYFLDMHEAVFNDDVHLNNPQFDLYTDTLHYNTDSKIARIVGPTTIVSGARIIKTRSGYYDTQNKFAELSKPVAFVDSTEVDSSYADTYIKDSINLQVVTDTLKAVTDTSDVSADSSMVSPDTAAVSSDSIVSIVQKKLRPEEKMYSESRNVIYTDTVNKNILICDYLYYKELEGYAVASDDPVTMEYSQGDTLYMHSDTIKMYTYNIDTDSVYRKVHCFNKVRAYRKDVQAVADSMMYNTADSCLRLYRSPILWNENKQVTGDSIMVFLEDSTLRKIDVIGHAVAGETTNDSTKYNQVSSRDIYAYFVEGELVRTDAVDNTISVFYPQNDKDSMAMMMNYLETDTMRIFLENRQLSKMWAPEAEGMSYPLTQIPVGKDIVPGFEWYIYMRPTDKYDIFEWRARRPSKRK